VTGTSGARPQLSLLLSDVDGTLVTDEKILTEATRDAVALLRRAGIRFAITSSRPPAGLAAVAHALAIDLPIAAFNGGMIVAEGNPPVVVEQHLLPAAVGRRTVELLAQWGIDAWVFTADRWLVQRLDGPYVSHEQRTVGFAPTVVQDLRPHLDGVGKIVGVSEDFALLERGEAGLRRPLGEDASVVRSQKYYLDVTHPRANKGTAVLALAAHLGVSTSAVATIGDGFNDIAMFAQAGLSIAMGNAAPAVQAAADLVIPATNEQDGFAQAVRRYILGDGGA
jgi:Cof subfamily protein (haloacid dehalogenase superfamily)